MKRLREADVFVHYSRWEGLSNSVLEAMALGLAVVASDIPGNREIVRHGRTGLLARTEQELLERTLELASRPELRADLGRAASALVRLEYSEERMLREYSALYAAR